MAKKQVSQEQPKDDEPVEYESVDPEVAGGGPIDPITQASLDRFAERMEEVRERALENYPLNVKPGYESVEPEVVEDEPVSHTPSISDTYAVSDWVVEDVAPDDIITKPGGEAVSLDKPTDERQYRVSFMLPFDVLVALLDQTHDLADWQDATFKYHLLEDGTLTPIGQLVLDGFDQTAVRHKMNAAWRAKHNSETGGV